MRVIRKFLSGLILSLLGLAAIWIFGGAMEPGVQILSKIPKHIALVQKRQTDPLASREQIQKSVDETPEGLAGLQQVLSQAPQVPANPSEKGVVFIDGTNFADPTALEKIERMNIPESMKDEILATYKRSGILPSFSNTREPANAETSASATPAQNH